MPNRTIRTKLLPFGVTGAIALAVMAGAGLSENVVAKPTPDKTAAAAKAALADGQFDKAIQLAEALVAASPREPSYRALLAHAYLKAGRFESAALTFDDAMKLGDNSGKTALGLALAYAAAGRNRDAVAILEDWRDAIPTADLGLALALAGEPTRGSAVLADALRNGENTPKLRQNLAYAYALDGLWREARLMMSQDIPADQVDARISDWASTARPEDYQLRVAGLLSAPVRKDPGQPTRLALNSNPVTEQLAAQSTAEGPAGELPPAANHEPAAVLASYTPVTAPTAKRDPAANRFAKAFGEPAGMQASTQTANSQQVKFVSQPVIQRVPSPQARTSRVANSALVRGVAPRRVTYAAPAPTAAPGTHLIQLGSFFTQQGARRAWGIYAAKSPELRKYRMTITRAKVRGKTYFRVAAAGITGNQGASNLCGAVKARGMACFAYTAPKPSPGVKARGATQMAQAKAPAAAPKAAPAALARARKR